MSDETNSPKRSMLRWVFVLGAVLLVAAGAILRATAPEPEPRADQPVVGIAVDVLTIASAPLRHRVRVSGLVRASRSVELFAEQDGRVLEVGAEALDRVAAGQLLLRIDPLPGEVEVARAEATLAQARSEHELAVAELRRMETLATSRVSSESELDRARSSAQVAVSIQRAAEASLRSARDRLSQRTLVAPFAGVLRTFEAEAGEYVSPGQRIGELLEVSRVRVTIGLRDRDVIAVEPGMRAEVEVDARPGEVFAGTVLRVAGAADERTRKFSVQVEIENDEGALMPGMVAIVDLALGTRAEALLVPHDAVLDEFGLAFVYVVERELDVDVARRRRVVVRSVPFQPGVLEVTEGLQVGERLATTSLRQLAEGIRVEGRALLPEHAERQR